MSESRERPPRGPGEKSAEDVAAQEAGAGAGGAREAKAASRKDNLEEDGRPESGRRTSSAEAAASRPLALSDTATVERVIRRATKLQMARAGRNTTEEARLSDEDILRIGEELGLDSSNVRQALVEVRTAKVRPKRKRETGLATRLFGDRYVRASLPVGMPAAEAQRVLEKHLADGECLAEVRRSTGASVWVPATGLATKIQRGLNLGRRAYILAKAQELTLSVVAVDEENSLVTITADLGNVRRERATGWSIGSVLLVTPAGAIVLALLGLPIELSILGGAGGAGGTAVSATRKALGNERTRMQAALDGLLERLRAGRPLEEPRGSFQDRFLR